MPTPVSKPDPNGVHVAVPLVEQPDQSVTAFASEALADEYAVLRLQLMLLAERPDLAGWLFWKYDPEQDKIVMAGASDPKGQPLMLPFAHVQVAIANVDFPAVLRLAREAHRR